MVTMTVAACRTLAILLAQLLNLERSGSRVPSSATQDDSLRSVRLGSVRLRSRSVGAPPVETWPEVSPRRTR